MDKQLHPCKLMGYNYSFMPKFYGGLDKTTLNFFYHLIVTSNRNRQCDNLFRPKSQLNHVIKKGLELRKAPRMVKWLKCHSHYSRSLSDTNPLTVLLLCMKYTRKYFLLLLYPAFLIYQHTKCTANNLGITMLSSVMTHVFIYIPQ